LIPVINFLPPIFFFFLGSNLSSESIVMSLHGLKSIVSNKLSNTGIDSKTIQNNEV